MFYAVQILMNGRQGTRASEFYTEDDAIRFAKEVAAMADEDVTIEAHIYKVTEIKY